MNPSCLLAVLQMICAWVPHSLILLMRINRNKPDCIPQVISPEITGDTVCFSSPGDDNKPTGPLRQVALKAIFAYPEGTV